MVVFFGMAKPGPHAADRATLRAVARQHPADKDHMECR